MSKYTPGPWFTGFSLHNGQECIIGDGDSVVCFLTDQTIGCTYKREDAWLIAAAPDLLNALSVLADAAESRGIPVNAARKAISKAMGVK